MAAAEYFSNAPMAQQAQSPYQLPPTSHPQAPTSNLNLNLNHSTSQMQAQQLPPPYQEARPGVHFAPTPVELHQRHSFSGQRPTFPSAQTQWSHPTQQPFNQPYPQHNMALQSRPSQPYGTSPYGTPPLNAQGTPPQRPQHLSPHMRPYAIPNSSQYSLDNGGYSSDPEPHRRKHKHHRRDSGESRSIKQSSRSKNADAFLGAAGGGLIGDLIFPGLGTVGGAAIGWLGGKDYANHRKGREDKRHKEQSDWEVKHGDRRSGSRDHSSRGSSTYLGEYDRRQSYDRRNSHY